MLRMESTSPTTTTEPVNFGKSIIVPSVQELAKQPLTKIPDRYAHPDQEPTLLGHGTCLLPSVPVIDLHKLDDEDSMESELYNLDSACKHWGFFQIINHGVPSSLLEELKSETKRLFEISYEEKQKLWQQSDNHEGFGQLFVVSDEQKLDWCDMFYITTLPRSLRQTYLFENLPSKFRETIELYSIQTKRLAMEMFGYMARALKIDTEDMIEMFSDGVQSMRMNFYPPCPEPNTAIGFTPHSDADALTILYQLNETQGLQIRKDGTWVPVEPIPGGFVVNVGDIMEIFSNGIYPSIEHRATLNSVKERMSIATFYSCKLDAELGPAPSLLGPDNPAVFRRVPVETYFKEFFSRKLNGKSYLDFIKIEKEKED